MRDEFARQFFRHFPTAAVLISSDAIAILVTMSNLIRMEICRIECRHAMLRRVAFMNPSGQKAVFEELSARFVLMRARLLEALFGKKPPKAEKSRRRIRRRKRESTRARDLVEEVHSGRLLDNG